MCHLLLFRLHSVWISMNFKQIINSQLECVLYSIMVFAVDWTISFAFSFPMLSLSLSACATVCLLLLLSLLWLFFFVRLFACPFVSFHCTFFCGCCCCCWFETRFYLQKNTKTKTNSKCFDFGNFFIYLFVEFINLIFQFVNLFSDKVMAMGKIWNAQSAINGIFIVVIAFSSDAISFVFFLVRLFRIIINFELIFRFL